VVTALALLAAVKLVPGIRVDGNAWVIVAVTAVILGFMNAVVRPILNMLFCGFIVLTLGLFLPVVNALTLWMSSWVAQNWFGVGFVVDGFWPALLGGLVVSVVSFFLNMFVAEEKD
jgi:putative membrane protein